MELDTYIVICKDEGSYELSTRRVFLTRKEAEQYAEGIHQGREPIVIPGRWRSLRLPVDPNADELGFTPETLKSYAKLCEDLRANCLFGTEDAGADLIAEQHYLAALAHLESAHRAFKLAQLTQARASSRNNEELTR